MLNSTTPSLTTLIPLRTPRKYFGKGRIHFSEYNLETNLRLLLIFNIISLAFKIIYFNRYVLKIPGLFQ